MELSTSSISNEIDKSIQEEFSVSQAAIYDAKLRKEKGQEPESISNEQIKKNDPILDTYKVLDDAIHGGMGSVWRVHHESWNVDLAMKRPQPRFFAEAGDGRKEEFIRECENWINLGLHPNIVSCYYVREIGGVPTIFSEWMDNGSLKDRIRDGSLYEGTEEEVQERILDIAIQTARGLKYSHENNLIHQDVKPGNILLTKDWDAKVADFGLAKAQSQLTENEKPVSTGYTIQYCPKEQAEGAPAEKWMDVYAWALTVLEMYAGKRLWETGAEAKEHWEEYLNQCRVLIPKVLSVQLGNCISKPTNVFSYIENDLIKQFRKSVGYDYPRLTSTAAADTADSLNNRALSFLDLGKPKNAESLWEKALSKEPDHPFSVFNAGLYKWRKGSITNLDFQRELEQVRGGTRGKLYQNLLRSEKYEEGQWKELGEEIFTSKEEAMACVINARYYDAVFCQYDIYSHTPEKESSRLCDLGDGCFSINYTHSDRSVRDDYYLIQIIENHTGRIITSMECTTHTQDKARVAILGVYALRIAQNTCRIAVLLENHGIDPILRQELEGFYVEEFEVSLGNKTDYMLSAIESTEDLLGEEAKVSVLLEQTAEHIKKRRYREAVNTLNRAHKFDSAVSRQEYRTCISEIGMKCTWGKIRQLVRLQVLTDTPKKDRLCFGDCYHVICRDRSNDKYYLEDIRDFSFKELELKEATQEDAEQPTGKHLVSSRFDAQKSICHLIYWEEENNRLLKMASARLHTKVSDNDFIQKNINPRGFCLMPSEHYLGYFINGVIFVNSLTTYDLDYTSFMTEEFGSGGEELKRQISAIWPSVFSDSLDVAGGRNGVSQFEKDSLILRISVEPGSVGKVMQRIKVPEDILAISLSPDGKILAVGTASGKLLLYDAKSGAVLFEVLETSVDVKFYDYTHDTYKLSFSLDGNYLIAGRALYFIDREVIYHEPTDCNDEVLPYFDLFLKQNLVITTKRKLRLYRQLAAAGYGYFTQNSVSDMLLDYKMRKIRQKSVLGRMVQFVLDHRKK